MDGASRARIVLGSIAILMAVLASLALLNVLLEEPLPVQDGNGNDGARPGGSLNFQPPTEDPGQQQQQQPSNGDDGGNDNPCTLLEPAMQGSSLTTAALSVLLWVVAVWWRQKRQTRVMNGWAIGALLLTLVSVTLMFVWWIVHKICSLDVFDLKNCLEIAHGLRNVFFVFLAFTAGLLGYGIVRWRKGSPFWSLWTISGLIFLYLMALALAGWLISEDLCERTFPEELPEDLEDRIDPNDPDDPGDPNDPDPNDPDPSDPNNPNPPDSGGNRGGGAIGQGGGGGSGIGGTGGSAPALPQISPFALLVVLGIAALLTIIVMAAKGRQDAARAAAMAALDMDGRAGMLKVFTDADLHSNDAIVKAYRTFLDHCLLYGVQKKHSETPREHGRRAAEALELDFDEMAPLLDAYLHVRLADGPLPEERRSAALGIMGLFRPRVSAQKRRKR